MKKLPILSLQQLNSRYAEQLKEAATRVIDSGWYLHGEENKLLEQEISHYIGTPHAIGVSNGLDALRLIFKAYITLGKLQEGDEVIVPANTFIATVLAITDNGLIPRFVEPSATTYNLDTSLIAQAITPRTRAICVVHLYGRPCWDENLIDAARRHNLLIIEDNAQAIGARVATLPHCRTGALGDAAGTSFYPGKNLGALGDAGIVTTTDAELAKTVRTLANYGGRERYKYEYTGGNCRLDELQAAFLRVKLPYLDAENSQRNTLATAYNRLIDNPHIVLPTLPDNGDTHVWHQYIIRTRHRDAFMHYMAQHEIGTDIHYPIPPHKQEAYPQYNHLALPLTEQLAQEVVSLPIAPYLTTDHIAQIASIINAFRP